MDKQFLNTSTNTLLVFIVQCKHAKNVNKKNIKHCKPMQKKDV